MFQDSFSYLLNFQTHILLISIEDIPIGKQRWRSLNYLLVRTLFLIFRKRRVQYQIFIFIYIHAFYKQLSKQYNNMENITHTKNYNTHTLNLTHYLNSEGYQGFNKPLTTVC